MRDADQKIGHARRHLALWVAVGQQYFQTGAVTYRLETVSDEDGTWEDWIAEAIHEPPPELALIAGDVVHNARAALDMAAYDMAVRNGKPGNRTYFPVTTSAQGWKDAQGKVAELSDRQRVAVLALQPWRSGSADLRDLHQLDIADKHAALTPVLLHQHGLQITHPEFDENLDPIPGTVGLQYVLNAAEKEFVKVGDQVFRRPADDHGIGGMTYAPAFRLAFAAEVRGAPSIQNAPVRATLERLVSAAAHAVAALSPPAGP